jgi:hypothetical protein
MSFQTNYLDWLVCFAEFRYPSWSAFTSEATVIVWMIERSTDTNRVHVLLNDGSSCIMSNHADKCGPFAKNAERCLVVFPRTVVPTEER